MNHEILFKLFFLCFFTSEPKLLFFFLWFSFPNNICINCTTPCAAEIESLGKNFVYPEFRIETRHNQNGDSQRKVTNFCPHGKTSCIVQKYKPTMARYIQKSKWSSYEVYCVFLFFCNLWVKWRKLRSKLLTLYVNADRCFF